MPRKIRQLKADLRKAGAYLASQEGSHAKWKHKLLDDTMVVLAGHDGHDAKPYQEKAINAFLEQIAQAKETRN